MSRVLGVGGYLVIAGLCATRAGAQDVRALRERVERAAVRAESLQAEVRLFTLDSAQRRTLSDTLAIAGGGLRVVTHRDAAPVVRAAAMRADSALAFIPGALPGLAGMVITVRHDTSRLRSGRLSDRADVEVSVAPNRTPFNAQADFKVDDLARTLTEQAYGRIAAHGGRPFLLWNRAPLPLTQREVDEAIDWGGVRYDVLGTRSLLGPRCYSGDVPACSMLLGLTPVDDPVMAWYDSTARVTEVRRRREQATRFSRADTDACLAGDDAACGRVLHTIKVWANPPAGLFARASLTREAIRLGGPGAADRILASRGTASQALAAGAGVPVDSIIRSWQRHLHDDSIESEDFDPMLIVVTLGWIAVLLFLATRISRWR